MGGARQAANPQHTHVKTPRRTRATHLPSKVNPQPTLKSNPARNKNNQKVAARLEAPNAPLGYALCAANLFLDGYTNAAQDEINRRHPANSPVHMMAWMNFWCALYYGAYLAGELLFSFFRVEVAWVTAQFVLGGMESCGGLSAAGVLAGLRRGRFLSV